MSSIEIDGDIYIYDGEHIDESEAIEIVLGIRERHYRNEPAMAQRMLDKCSEIRSDSRWVGEGTTPDKLAPGVTDKLIERWQRDRMATKSRNRKTVSSADD